MSPLFDLSGKRALVTGSSQGIGLALAEGLAAHGLAFDVTLPSVAESIDKIEAEIGAIDILINNAGMQFRTPLEDFPADKWEQLLTTNISSVFYVGQAVARAMIARKA